MDGHAKNDDFPIDFAIFTKALPTDGPADRRTDIPSYRDAIAASKNKAVYTAISVACGWAGAVMSLCKPRNSEISD